MKNLFVFNKKNIVYYSITAAVLIIVVFAIYKILGSNKKIIQTAQRYIGQKEKTSGSYEVGFENANFESKMRDAGFREGYDWCAIFVKHILLSSFKGEKKEALKTLLTPSTQGTYKNFKDNQSKYSFYSISKTPKVGAIAVYQNIAKPYAGHFALVKEVKRDGFMSVEGNVPAGGGKDGVISKFHSFDEFNKTSGNKLIDFINFK